MALVLRKSRVDVLRQALRRLEKNTPITAVGAGSIARAFTEAITGEVSDLYDVLDFNVSQSLISTASGRSLDLIGQLYNTQRRTVSSLVQTDRQLGSFYFYLDTPYIADLTIPKGTKIYTAGTGFISQQLYYTTTSDVTIPQGRLRVYVGLAPAFDGTIYTAGANTLIEHSFVPPLGAVVKCNNPKPIAAQPAYEDDNNYRLRLIKSIRVSASGTAEAIRFAALAVGGVRDIKVFDASFGLGSFEVLVIPETRDLNASVAIAVRDAVNTVRPMGLSVYFRTPDYLAIDITANIFLPPTAGLDRALAQQRASIAILRYLNTLLPGDTLVYNKLLQFIFDSSDYLQDVQMMTFAPNGTEALRKNFTPKKNQMIIPGNIQVTST